MVSFFRYFTLILLIFFQTGAHAVLEVKSSFLPSLALVGRNDLIFSSHNTLMVGVSSFRLGGYASFETISTNTTDQAYGAALRIGDATFFEAQGGYFVRKFSQHKTETEGKGVAANLILGTHLGKHFGLSLFLAGKRINSGMDKRTIVDLLPYLTLRAEL